MVPPGADLGSLSLLTWSPLPLPERDPQRSVPAPSDSPQDVSPCPSDQRPFSWAQSDRAGPSLTTQEPGVPRASVAHATPSSCPRDTGTPVQLPASRTGGCPHSRAFLRHILSLQVLLVGGSDGAALKAPALLLGLPEFSPSPLLPELFVEVCVCGGGVYPGQQPVLPFCASFQVSQSH